MTRVLIVIPARYASTRFPGKPLADLWGKPLIQHVYERACRVSLASRVVVATDDERIAAAVRAIGGETAMTRGDHPSGTDRVAEVANGAEADLVVNLQGDEPLIHPEMVDAAISPLAGDASISMGTLCCPIDEVSDLADPNVVKVVLDKDGFALYFSRLPIPFVRDSGSDFVRYRHLGIYVYRREFLLALSRLPPTPLERAERLEQLRALEHGHRIRVVLVSAASPGVDTPADLEQLRRAGPPTD